MDGENKLIKSNIGILQKDLWHSSCYTARNTTRLAELSYTFDF